MALLTRVELTDITGSDPGFVTPAGGGDTFPVDDFTVFHCVNGDASPINVTFTSTVTAESGLAAADVVVAVPAGEERHIRMKPAHRFKDGNGQATATCSATSSITVAVTRVA